MSKKNIIFSILLLIIGVIVIGIIMSLSGFNLDEFLNLIQNVPTQLLLFWFFLIIIEFILHVIRFEIISGSKKSFKDVAVGYNLGHLITFLAPSRAIGEGLRVLVFKKTLGLDDSKAFSSVTIERVFDLIILCVALTGVLFIFSNTLVPLFIFLIVFCILFVLRSSRVHRFILKLIPFKRVKDLAAKYFKETYTFTRNNIETGKVIFVTSLVWIVNFYRFFSILNYSGIAVSFSLVSGIGALSYFAMVISVFPGGMGFFEGVGTGSFALLGYDSSLVLSAIFIERIFSYWLFIVTGIIIYLIKLYFDRKEKK